MRTTDIHHRIERCNTKDKMGEFPTLVNRKKHQAFHTLFKNCETRKPMTVPEMVEELNKNWVNPNYLICFIDLEEEKKKTTEEKEVENV